MGAGRRVRLADVAREAGVSVATASHALTGNGRVAESTRVRVQEVAGRLGYAPDPAAKRLAGGRSHVIAVVFSLPQTLPVNITDVDYFSQAIRAATERALEDDYALVIGPPTAQTKVWERIPLDGVVVFDPVAGDPILAEFRARNIPLVLSGRDPDGGDDPCVDNDHVEGTRTVLDHLAERGAERVGLLAADLGDAFTADCIATYEAWCRERGVEPLLEVVPMEELREPDAADRILAMSPAPDAVYATVEALGLTIVRAAERLGLGVPEDLLVAVAADREPLASSVPLTTLELDPARTAASAVEMLIDVIEGRPPAERDRSIPTRLVVRESTTPVT